MMRRSVLATIVLGLPLLAVASYVSASPTLVGPSGGAFLPNAQIAPLGDCQVALDYYDTDYNSTSPLRGLYGISPNLEVGGIYVFNNTSDVWGLNAKWGFSICNHPGFALGAAYLNARDLDFNAEQVYLLHSHHFDRAKYPVQGTLGINWTRVHDFTGSDNQFRVFGSADVLITDQFLVGVEIQSRASQLGDAQTLTSLYTRYQYGDGWTLQAGLSNASPFGLLTADDHRLFVGVCYEFGGRSKAHSSLMPIPLGH